MGINYTDLFPESRTGNYPDRGNGKTVSAAQMAEGAAPTHPLAPSLPRKDAGKRGKKTKTISSIFLLTRIYLKMYIFILFFEYIIC